MGVKTLPTHGVCRDWYLFTSSSGQTLQVLWHALTPEQQKACRGILIDRSCPAIGVAQALPGAPAVKIFERPQFEARALAYAQSLGDGHREPLVLLCGFFGILSAAFLKEFPGVLVNTHPSLLPAFPGMDKKVHARAAQSVALSGFTVHLVTEELDGGSILFQHPVWVNVAKTPDDLRADVRAAEQALLPKIWSALLHTDLNKSDLASDSFNLRKRLALNTPYFYEELS